MTELAVAFLGVLAFSAFFSGAEAVLLSITPAEAEAFARAQRRGAGHLLKVQRSLSRAISAIVILNNIVNIAGAMFIGNLALQHLGSASLAAVTALLTFCVILFSEVVPKTLGIHYSHMLAIPIAVVIRPVIIAFLPVVLLLELLMSIFKRGERKIGTEQQIRALATIGRREGHIESDEGQLVHRAFILNDKTARDIMTPLKDVISVAHDETIGDAAHKVFRENHSRFPVFGSSIHDAKGIVMSHDILQAMLEEQGGQSVSTIVQPGLVVTANTRCDRLLMIFRDEHTHLAVVQEDAHTIGIVTLEDVLEELVGEIEDERDVRD